LLVEIPRLQVHRFKFAGDEKHIEEMIEIIARQFRSLDIAYAIRENLEIHFISKRLQKVLEITRQMGVLDLLLLEFLGESWGINIERIVVTLDDHRLTIPISDVSLVVLCDQLVVGLHSHLIN
jgi:hypothetical protein